MQSSSGIHQNRTNENSNSFSSHALSNISAPGRKQISPTFNSNISEFNIEQWISNTAAQANPPCMSRTDQICLDANDKYSQIAPLNPNSPVSIYFDML
jgi:hypothetical protein